MMISTGQFIMKESYEMDMLSFQLTRDQEKPLYEQLYQQIRNEIIVGRLAYGTKLPSKRKLG